MSSADLVKEYERQTQRQRGLLRRSAMVQQRLAVVASGLKRILADDRLKRLLRTEGLDSIPAHLASRLT